MSKKFTDIDVEALDGLVERVTEAVEHNLALSPEDLTLLLTALTTLASLQERIGDHKITIHKLRKLLGIVKSSENLNGVLNPSKEGDEPTAKPQKKTEKTEETTQRCRQARG